MRFAATVCLLALLTAPAAGYPLDGAAKTGIRRLTGYRLANDGKIAAWIKLPPGGLRTMADVRLRLKGVADGFDITASTPRDPYLQSGLEKIFAGRDPSYSVAVLDITDPAKPRYAALKEHDKRIPGSVGKLLVATGMFGAAKRTWPNDTAARERFLRDTVVAADSFVHVDSKTVPFYKDGDRGIANRRLQIGDKFNLYEWLDHALSQSSNAAAAFTWEQAMLLYRFGTKYPLSKEDTDKFFKETPRAEIGKLALETLETSLTEAGLDTSKIRLGSMFTSGGERVVPGTGSYACPSELMRWLVKLEQGKLVDEWSSLELKRLMYFSRPRYRYSSAPALNNAAVYFKSGSLFECVPEPGFQCVQYRGNKLNLMHSVAIVESGTKAYMVALMSNVLRLNSATEHQTIGTLIERLIQSRPGE